MQKFSLNHIKSFEYSKEVEIKPLTIFVGKNSSGKSSLLRFPVVLAQTFRDDTITPLLLFGSLIDYGNYDDVAYRHKRSPFGFGISFGQELSRFVNMEYQSQLGFSRRAMTHEKHLKAELEVLIEKPLKKLDVARIELHLDGEKICTIVCASGNVCRITVHKLYCERRWETWEVELEVEDIRFNKFIPRFEIYALINQLCTKREMLKKNGNPISEYGYLRSLDEYIERNIYKKNRLEFRQFCETIEMISMYFGGMRRQLANEADNLAYIGPFRENPERIYRNSESSYHDVGVNGENTSMLLRQAVQEDKELLKDVSGWLHSAMGYNLDIKDVGNGLYSLVVSGNGESDNIMDVGYGISQVLPIVTQLFINKNNNGGDRPVIYRRRKTVIFEQPEIHLHPAAQAQLADLFVDCVSNRKGTVDRILIETHSEHLIRKLQVLVADPDVAIQSDQVAIYYVDKDESGNSFIEEMKLCENGQFEKPWPSGFFDKNYELTRLLMRANNKILQQEKQDD